MSTRNERRLGRKESVGIAAVLIVGAWIVGFAPSTATALQALSDPATCEVDATTADFVDFIVMKCVLSIITVGMSLIGLWLLSPRRGQQPPLTPRQRELADYRPGAWKVGVWYFGITLFFIGALAGLVPSLCSSSDYTQTTTLSTIYDIIRSAWAGPTEELLFGALIPAVILAFSPRHPWRMTVVAIAISASLRVLFHLYYGWPAQPFFFLWASSAVLLWVLTRRVWPLVIAHSLYDLRIDLGQLFRVDAGLLMTFLVMVYLVVLAVTVVPQFVSTPKRKKAATE